MDITLIVNGNDFSDRLSTFRVEPEITYAKVIQTIDGEEYAVGKRVRDVVIFRLFPQTDEQAAIDFETLSAPTLTATYTYPPKNIDRAGVALRLVSNLDYAYGLTSAGHRRYKGGAITLRAVRPDEMV